MPIPRHLKHPIALWIIDSRKAMNPPWTPRDVSRAIDVDEGTVRAWETARAGQNLRLPSADNLDAMARLFGKPAPGREALAPGDQTALVGSINALVLEIQADREARNGSIYRRLESLEREVTSLRAEWAAWREGYVSGGEPDQPGPPTDPTAKPHGVAPQ